MTCETPCKNCDRTGLPILFTRYAAAYSAQDKGMAALKPLQPTGHFQRQPGGVALQTALYNVRMLRPGYLYVHIDRGGAGGEDQWKGYAVHPHGYLAEFDVLQPGSAEVHVACARDARQANNSMVWVKDAKRVKKLWYVFHPDPIDPEHLFKEIVPNLGKYMQSFDVAGWANGSTFQKDTCQPGQINGQVVEFAALGNDELRNAIAPQLFGLMGANAKERGWGDYSETRSAFAETAGGAVVGARPVKRTVEVDGPEYDAAHGARLKKMAEFLQTEKGAVVACEDAIGVAQELGYLQAEALSMFTYWQGAQAKDFAAGVSNEWVFQTWLGGQSMADLVKKGAIEKTNARIKGWNERRLPTPQIYPDAETRQREMARRDAAIARNQQAERDAATKAGDAEFQKYFNAAAAKPIADARDKAYNDAQQAMAHLGDDQVLWLRSPKFQETMNRYSALEGKVNKPGGGAALSLQLAQCMAGTEGNSAGQKWLLGLGTTYGDPLGRALCFNNPAYLDQLKQMLGKSAAPAAEPGADPQTKLADSVADMLKMTSGRFSLGDKALAFIEAVPAISESDRLRKLAWVGHIATLMTVKSMRTVNGWPLPRMEIEFVRSLALTGITTLGSTAQKQAGALQLEAKAAAAERDRIRNAQDKLESVAHRTSRDTLTGGGARNSRAAGLGAALDIFAAMVKGNQFGNKLDARSGLELVQQTLQGVGNLLDWRAKAYEEAIFKGVSGANYYNAKAMTDSFETLKSAQLAVVRKVAFKVLVPAAVIGAALDAWDAWKSIQRGDRFLAVTQMASVIGTAFAIVGIGVAAFDVSLFGLASGTLAATLGLVGAVLTLGAVILIGGIAWLGIAGIKDEDWVNWLKDGPLSTTVKAPQRPIHKNLGDTLQMLSNAKAAI